MSKLQESIYKVFAVGGTLVLGIPTQEGLFIAADKRTNDTERGSLDTKTKIIQLEPKVAIASTGTPEFYMTLTDSSGKKTSWKAFDVDNVVIDYCKSINFENTKEFFESFFQHLDSKFQQFLHSQPKDGWPPSGDGEDNALFQTIFFFVDQSGMMGITTLIFKYKKEDPPSIKIRAPKYRAEFFENVLPFVAGDTNVYFKIEDENDDEFNDLKNEQSVKRLLKERPDVKTVSVDEAEKFCRKIIKATSEKTHKVGPRYDSAIIPFEGDFRWLNPDKSVNDN